MEYDKLTILKKVWSSHAKIPKALEVITYICIGYDFYVPQIWNGVLKQMVGLNMVYFNFYLKKEKKLLKIQNLD